MSSKGSINSARSVILFLFAGAALASCGPKNDNQAAAPVGQVVARVGDQVVAVQELETEFRWANVPNERRRDPEIVKRILGELVTRKYLLHQAQEAKLDREPTVLLDLLRAREQVLANAFASRQVASRSSALTKADIEKFIANNPAKFANQQIMNVDQITLSLNSIAQSTIEAMKSLNSLEEIDQKLTSLGIPHSRSTGSFNSAEIPDELLQSIRAQKSDEVFFARAGQNGVFIKVRSIASHPVDGEAAVALARQLIRNDLMKTEASMANMAANLEAKYADEYSKIMGAQTDKPRN